MKSKQGFTIIELVIALAVLGLLATLAAVAVNGAQKKVRDNRRIEDMNMIRSAMQLIYNQTGSYDENTCAAESKVADCQGEEILKLIDNIQDLKDPASKGLSCVAKFDKGCDYAFKTLNHDSYSVLFYLEKGTQGYSKGPHILTGEGIQ